jgi:hypothetical protein
MGCVQSSPCMQQNEFIQPKIMFSGTWIGESDKGLPLLWSMAIVSAPEVEDGAGARARARAMARASIRPTIFGCARTSPGRSMSGHEKVASDSKTGDSAVIYPVVALLRGNFEKSDNTFLIRQLADPVGSGKRRATNYSGKLTVSPGEPPRLVGRWSECRLASSTSSSAAGEEEPERQEESGEFSVRLLEPNSSVHLSGMCAGEAAPAADLHEWYFPTNPITWSTSCLHGLDGDFIGAGYFEDAGEAADQGGLLFFTLSGRVVQDRVIVDGTDATEADSDSVSGTNPVRRIAFEKVYVNGDGEEIENSMVRYTGTIAAAGRGQAKDISGDQGDPEVQSTQLQGGAGGWQMQGSWANVSAGSYGDFHARSMPTFDPLPTGGAAAAGTHLAGIVEGEGGTD